MSIFSVLLIWLFSWVVVVIAAGAKSRSVLLWAMLGFLFGPIAILGIIAMPSKSEERRLRADLQRGTLRRCPDCAEPIRREAIRCKHCGASVEPLAPKGLFG